MAALRSAGLVWALDKEKKALGVCWMEGLRP
jgi:hypothetical protein